MEQFVQEWFDHPEWWFNAGEDVDTYISDRYSSLLDIEYDISGTSIEADIGHILVYDQLPRHVFRGEDAAHIIAYYLRKACDASAVVEATDKLDQLSDEEWCFAMLPYRHTNDIRAITRVAQLAWKRLSGHPNSGILRRFIRATYERCPTEDQRGFLLYGKGKEDWDAKAFSSILGYQGCPMGSLEDNSVVTGVQTAFQRAVEQYISSTQPIIISLSGGVDSMVCLHVLHRLRLQHKIGTIKIVHINYTNRPTAYDEEAFAVAWAGHLGYPVYVRRIEEAKREVCMTHDMRDVYESYTRNVRYGTYNTVSAISDEAHNALQERYGRSASLVKPAIEELGSMGTETMKSMVVLGHNKDDCLENIFTNISHRSKYDNLYGMSHLNQQDGGAQQITFFRPLLGVSKDDIIKYAHDHGIPYLPNSTPTWSQRGQIRANVVPCLNEWNPMCIPGMFAVAEYLQDVHQLVDAQVGAFVYKLQGTYSLLIQSLEELPISKVFWKMVLPRLGCMASVRAIDMLVTRLAYVKQHGSIAFQRCPIIRIELHKNMQVQLESHKSGTAFTLRFIMR
jgi:tRNA(Ile)-lysidine synthase TilS/MesJ/uncharacterized protein (DUF924 family)